MWFLYRKEILTKDNLIKRNWQGPSSYCFCDQAETVDHLFISCPFAKLLRRTIFITFNIPPPTNINNLFGNWLNGVLKKDKGHIRVGVCALLWALWNVRNDFVFNKKSFPCYVGYFFGYALDSYVVFPAVGGGAPGHGY